MPVHPDVTSTIGGTPLVHLSRFATGARVLGKVEAANPGGSVKDRVALAIVSAAEAVGALAPGGLIVEATSGNTGIGLAMVGAARGYRVAIVMPESMSVERRALVQMYGAELYLTPKAEGMRGAVERAERLVAETPGSILASQFANAANPEHHYRVTAAEILEDAGSVDVLVAGVGTGGSVTGIGRRLKEANPALHVVAVEPADSPLLSEGKAGPHGIQGIGANFVPENLDRSVVDEVTTVTTADSIAAARELARTEGLLVGISCGAAAHVAREVASRPENAGRTVVVVLPDTGERYLSTPLFEDLPEPVETP